jgi:hypothetical protein
MRKLGWFLPFLCLLTMVAGVAPAGATTTPPDCAGSSATLHFDPPLRMTGTGTPETVTLKVHGEDCGAHGNPTTIQSAVASVTFAAGRLQSCRPLLAMKPWQQTTAGTGRVRYQPAGTPASSLSEATFSQSSGSPPDAAALRVHGNVVKGSFAGDQYGVFMLPDMTRAQLHHQCAIGGLATLSAGAAEFAIG